MDERQMELLLAQLIGDMAVLDSTDRDSLGFYGEGYDAIEGAEIRGFDEAGLLTTDTGIVVSFADGSEFQLTIKQSR